MNTTRTITPVTQNQNGLVNHDLASSLVNCAKERAQDLLHESRTDLAKVFAEIKQLVTDSEAEFDVDENVSIIFEKERVIVTANRNTHFAKGP